MILYKRQDIFDRVNGTAVGYVYAGVICDFTGDVYKYQDELGTGYSLEYGNIDPNCGDGVGEYEFAKKYKADVHGFLTNSSYVFNERYSGVPVMEQILQVAKAEGFDRMYFDQLFRWCRIRTADKLLSSGKYTLEDLGIELSDDFDDEEE